MNATNTENPVRKKVVVTDHPFRGLPHETAMTAAHGADFEVHSCEGEADTARAVAGADVALVGYAPITRDVLSQLAPGATVIRYGIGVDNVDVEAAQELGIAVANIPDYGVETVADHASASLLTLLRRLPIYDSLVKIEGWVAPAAASPLRGFRTVTVGLVGLGRIAQAVHHRLAPFGFTFVATDPYCPDAVFDRLGVERVTIDELAVRAHAISLHAPGTTENHHLIGRGFLARVPIGTVIVNTARGSLLDLEALAEAVRDGRVAGAALDVTDPEPLPADSALRSFPQIVLTPHAAFYDEQSIENLQRLASEEAARALTAQPLRCRIV